jgi:hypothetical protein
MLDQKEAYSKKRMGFFILCAMPCAFYGLIRQVRKKSDKRGFNDKTR